ncbi:hypothetical protein [Yoonia vestfoldensis]|jgi:hypothetical protein|uniref:Uncharacterized protein n=1 Tax=Yoonia vestfoldensis TaxID=245188 RepID=A0A1Y0EA94_9RHOB|nr:hypothetical protein [Yoonia vestfoldensis]ARU00271.1 hypothetical protein LOKVESSMR4R_00940 [Yoonia vestfoldensis]
MMDLLRILIAPLVWLAAFSAIYALHGVICGFGIAGSLFGLSLARGLLVAAFALAIMAQVALLWLLAQARFRSDAQFVNVTARATAWVGLVATLWTLSPIVLTSACI